MVNFWLFANDNYNDTKNLCENVGGLKGNCAELENDLNQINSRIGRIKKNQEEERLKAREKIS